MSDLRFLVPAGLFALLSLPLIYLFHMRSPTPKAARVPSLRFWRVAAPKPTEEPRFRRPPLTLDLLLHLAIAALLAFALARPVTTAFAGAFGASGDPIHQIILLDGSTSMASTGDIAGKSRFDQARESAQDRIGSLRSGDSVTLLLFGSRMMTRSASDPAAVNQLESDLDSLQLPGGSADLTAVLLLAGDLRVPGIENRLLLLSDGALSADPSAVSGLGMEIEDRRFGPEGAGNLAILDVTRRNDPARPAAGQLLVSIGNFSSLPNTSTISVTVDDVPVAERSVSFSSEERRVELFNLPANAGTALIRLSPGDSQIYDDAATIQLDGGGFTALNVLIFSDHPDPLARAFGALPGAQVTVETTDAALEGLGTAGFDVAVYDQVIPATAPSSPALFVSPPDSPIFRSPEVLADPAITVIDPGDPLLNGVDLTGIVFGTTPLYALTEGFTAPVQAADGPLVAYGVSASNGLPVALLAMPLQEGNLTERIAFPILIANLADWLAPMPPPSTVKTGEPLIVTPLAITAAVTLVAPDGSRTTLPAPAADAGDRSVSFAETGEPGIYVIDEADADGVLLLSRRVSVNAGSAAESDLRTRSGLSETLAAATASTQGGVSGERMTELWPLLVGLAIVLALIEWLNSVWIARRPLARVSGGVR